MRRWAPLLILAAALPILFALIAAAPACAHAVLVTSDPVDGARLSTAPERVTLTFDESVRPIPSAIQVITDTGERVDAGLTMSGDGTQLILALRPNLHEGSYTATWKVISADSHEVVGAISFGVGREARPLAAPQRHHDENDYAEATLARGATFVGVVFCLGVGLVCAVLWPVTLNRTVTKVLCGVGLYLVVAGSEIQLTAHHGDHSGGPPGGTLALVRLAIALLLIGVGIAIFRKATRTRISIGAVCGVALAVTIAMDGHGGVGADAPAATVATTAHLIAMAVWTGGLIAMCVVVLPARTVVDLHHWSQIAFGCVCILVVTGVYQAWRQISPLQALWSTSYGLALCAKIAGVSAMLGLALFARRRLTRSGLWRAIALETGMAAVVLAVTTVLVALPPARTSYGPPVALNAPLEAGSHVAVEIASTRRGPLAIQVRVLDDRGRVLRVESIDGALSSKEAEIPSLPVDLRSQGQNQWRSSYASAPRPGEWTLRLTVRLTPSNAIVTGVKFRVW